MIGTRMRAFALAAAFATAPTPFFPHGSLPTAPTSDQALRHSTRTSRFVRAQPGMSVIEQRPVRVSLRSLRVCL